MPRSLREYLKIRLDRYRKDIYAQVQRDICKKEFYSQEFRIFNERPVELSFTFRNLGAIYPRTILDVGTGKSALPHLMRNCGFLVTAIDNIRDYWPSEMVNRHYHIVDDDITATSLKNRFDLITCISVLEHIEKADAAVKNMFSLLVPDGYLILTLPYSETEKYVRNVYELPASTYGQTFPFITQSFSRSDLDRWTMNNNGGIVEQEFWQFWEGDYWTVGHQTIPPSKVTANEKHQLTCVLIRKRGSEC